MGPILRPSLRPAPRARREEERAVEPLHQPGGDAPAPHRGQPRQPARAEHHQVGVEAPGRADETRGLLSALDRDARAVFRREHIGVVGQTPGLSGMLTARENVELVLGLRGIDGVESHERAMDALAIVGLADRAARRVDRLSAGERERVALARSIASGPGVLVADEPTARLDSATTLAIGGLLADLAREHGTTVICATHDPLLVTLAGAEVALRRTTPAAV